MQEMLLTGVVHTIVGQHPMDPGFNPMQPGLTLTAVPMSGLLWPIQYSAPSGPQTPAGTRPTGLLWSGLAMQPLSPPVIVSSSCPSLCPHSGKDAGPIRTAEPPAHRTWYPSCPLTWVCSGPSPSILQTGCRALMAPRFCSPLPCLGSLCPLFHLNLSGNPRHLITSSHLAALWPLLLFH